MKRLTLILAATMALLAGGAVAVLAATSSITVKENATGDPVVYVYDRHADFVLRPDGSLD